MLVRLKQLRWERGISQQVLADAVLVSQASINKYENHSIEPEPNILIRIADYFGTSVDYLIRHNDERRIPLTGTSFHQGDPTTNDNGSDRKNENSRYRYSPSEEKADMLDNYR